MGSCVFIRNAEIGLNIKKSSLYPIEGWTTEVIISALLMTEPDYYRIAAGSELDQLVHRKLFRTDTFERCPRYSEDENDAKRALKKLKSTIEPNVTIGKTRSSKSKRYFARYGSDPSTSTEVLAESLPLAICRMIALRTRDRRAAEDS